MKLSKHQEKVLKLMGEGWELGTDTYEIRHTGLCERGRLQKNGLGRGDPIEYCKIVTVDALVKKGLLERLDNPYIMIKPTRYRLTKEGERYINIVIRGIH